VSCFDINSVVEIDFEVGKEDVVVADKAEWDKSLGSFGILKEGRSFFG